MIYIEEGGFYINSTEITNRQYEEFIRATGHCPPCYWIDNKPPQGDENAPVVYVNFHDAQKYAEWIDARIPTEEEWELAAQASKKNNELKNLIDDGKRGNCEKGGYPDRETNVAEWTNSSFTSHETHFKTVHRGFVEQSSVDVPVIHRAPMFEKDANISTGFRCVR